jgi:release factor glutamine methyltransferase
MNIETLLHTDLALSIPSLDAELLLAHVLSISRTQLLTWPLQSVSEGQTQAFQSLLRRRAQGEPFAYLVGTKEFWSLPLIVNADVLIPRPETECLVEALLTRFPADDSYAYQVLDLGTGSGAIALALAVERPHWQIIALDRSEAALAVAKQNAQILSVDNIQWIASDWFSALRSERCAVDIIVSNPPYIEEEDIHLRQDGLCYEPQEALVAGRDGLSDLHQIICIAPAFLKPGGCLAVEHGSTQGLALRLLMKKQGFTQEITLKDLGGLDRLSLAYT